MSLQTSNSRKATLALSNHSPEPSVHEAARNVQIIGSQCVITVPVGVHHHPVHVVYELSISTQQREVCTGLILRHCKRKCKDKVSSSQNMMGFNHAS